MTNPSLKLMTNQVVNRVYGLKEKLGISTITELN